MILWYGCGCSRYDRICSLLVIGEADEIEAFLRYSVSDEEIDFGTINDIPFLLEESLARSAARFSKVQPWQELVIVDERVITGQNPTSAHGVGQKLVEILA